LLSDIFFLVVLLVTFLAIVWIETRYSEEKSFLRIVTFTSLFFGILIAALVRTAFGDILEDPAYFPDAYNYLSYAAKKVSEWRGEGTLGYIPLNTRGYSYFIALVYSIFGTNLNIVIFIQLLLASLIPVLTFLISKQIFDKKTARISALIVAFFPDFYVWASFALKEILAIFIICLTVLQFLKFRKHQNFHNFLFTMGLLGLLLFIRPHIALFLGLLFVFFFIWPITFKKFVWSSIAVVVFTAFMSQAGLSNFLTIISKTTIFVYNRGEILVTGTLPELLRMLISGKLLPNFIIGIGRYLISPLPWQASNAYQALIPGIILWYFLLPVTVWGMIGSIKNQKHIHFPLLIVMFLIFWYGFVSTGTDPRWRLMIVPFMSMFGAYGFRLLIKSLSGVMIWTFGVLVIWLFLLLYAMGIKFAFWVFAPIIVIGAGLTLRTLNQRVIEVKE